MATFILIISSFEAVNYNYFTFLIFVNTSSIITVSSVCYNRFSYFLLLTCDNVSLRFT